MEYFEFLLRAPRFWTLVSALFAGGGISRLVLALSGRDRREERRRRRVTAFFLHFACAVAAYTAGIFLPPEYGILSRPVLLLGAGAVPAAVLFFSLFRYLFAPVALFVAVGIIGGIYLNATWTPVYEDRGVAIARVIRLDQERFSVEVVLADAYAGPRSDIPAMPASPDRSDPTGPSDPPVESADAASPAPPLDDPTLLIDGRGNGLAPKLEVLRYHPAYFLLGRRTAVLFVGFAGYREDPSEEGRRWIETESYPIADDHHPLSASLRDLARRIAVWLPGITVDRVTGPIRALRLLERYRVVALPDGDVGFASTRM
jgi:hypothetical protein